MRYLLLLIDLVYVNKRWGMESGSGKKLRKQQIIECIVILALGSTLSEED